VRRLWHKGHCKLTGSAPSVRGRMGDSTRSGDAVHATGLRLDQMMCIPEEPHDWKLDTVKLQVLGCIRGLLVRETGRL